MEQIIKNTNEAERQAELRERQIVKFTNIDTERFTHSFRGISISVDAGVEQIMRLPEADHLAIHLARKILSRQRKALKNDDRNQILFSEEEVNKLKQQIITNMAEENKPDKMTKEEARLQDQQQLEQKYMPEKKPIEATKKEIIDELEKRGLKIDPSKSKEELLTQLMEVEASGN